MKQQFRDNLTAKQLRSRLFETANKSGKYSNRSIYGNGLMDLGAATSPWGVPAFMGSQSTATGAGGMPIASSFVRLGAPLGDGLPQTLASQEVAAFDSLGAPFWFQASSFTVPASGTSLAANLHRFLNPAQQRLLPDAWQFSFQEDAPAIETGHLALTDGASRLNMDAPSGFAVTAFQRPQDSQSPLAGLAVSWSPLPLPGMTLSAGYLDEQRSLLGSQAGGAFGQFSGQTLFLTAGLDAAIPGGWQFAAQGELGMVNPSVTSSQFINSVSPLSTSAFRLEASKTFLNDTIFRLSLSQPLRVDSGAASLSLPTGRTQEGIVVGKNLSAPLVPSGRQLDLSAQLDFPLAGGDFSLGATRSQQPRHQGGASPEWTFFTGYRTNW